MIRHIVFFSIPDPARVDFVVNTLRGYAAIPEVRSIEVERNNKRDAISHEIDVVLHATFDDLAALERYKRHPIYEAGTRAVRPLRHLRFVADYAATPDEGEQLHDSRRSKADAE
ncbi:MAG: Dabb family protein [Pseudomonadota bacterium]